MSKPKVIAIVGPTASGKTSMSIKLAQAFSGEVISADSRQVYRGMDIGTGKVTSKEMEDVPHHLLDVADPKDIFTGADFLHLANKAISNITKRCHLPIIAGGTFFYVDLLRGKLAAAPVKPDAGYRASIEHLSNIELFELLQQQDPRRAKMIDPQNRRRLVRSLEIINTLGNVPQPVLVESGYNWLIIGMNIDKVTLQDRFLTRLQGWLARGLVDEVKQIRTHISLARFREFGFEYTLTADYIDKRITKDELFEKFVQKNWQYAKRQLTWLKRDADIEWFSPDDHPRILQRVNKFLAQ